MGRILIYARDNPLILEVDIPGAGFVWQDSSTQAFYEIQSEGSYWVEVQNGACFGSDTVDVEYKGVPEVDLGPDTSLCLSESYLLIARQPEASYVWQNGHEGPTYTINSDEKNYWVRVKNNCGEVSDTLYVHFKNCACNMFIPNAFTPNNDDLNDVFAPVSNCPVTLYRLSIFDRWGGMVYSSTNAESGWDGTYNGEELPNGMYVYRLQYSHSKSENNTEIGQVNLMR